MKTVVAILLAAALGFGSAWFITARKQGNKAAEAAANEANWQQEKAYLEQQLAEARKRGPVVRTVDRTFTTTVTNRLAPQEIIERLVKLRPEISEESDSRVFRQIIFYLQTLAGQGSEALPVIHEFLKQNKDVDYSTDVLNAAGERISRSGTTSFQSRSVIRTEFLVPPSLRLGLLNVLDQVGGEEAEAILAEVLDTTGRGVEVAYIARILQEETPNKYKDNALKAAKDLLANLPPIDQPNRIDENARAYLFQVLAMYRDTSFAETAQAMLVTADGRIDRQALNFLSTTLQDQSVAALNAAYNNPRLTNPADKSSLLNSILNFTGPSAQANQIFNQLVNNEKVPSPIRAYAIQNLAGSAERERPSDPQVIQSRIKVLQDLRGSLKDERILRSIDDTIVLLQKFHATATRLEQ